MRPLLCALLALGCAAPTGPNATHEGVALRALEGAGPEGGLALELTNGSNTTLQLDRNPVWLDAQEVDGEMVPVDRVYGFQLGQGHSQGGPLVHPGESIVLRPEYAFSALGRLRPGVGRVRVVYEVDGEPGEVAFERTTMGWGPEVLREARTLRARAVEAECPGLVRDVDDALLEHLDPEPLETMHREVVQDPRRRDAVALEMLDRGGFGDHLFVELSLADLDAVRPVARRLVRMEDETYPALRGLVTERLLEQLLVGDVAIGGGDLETLEDLAPSWPEGTVERLIARLAEGPETGWDEIELVNLFLYARHDELDARSADVMAALAARCPATVSDDEDADRAEEFDQVDIDDPAYVAASLLSACATARRRYGSDALFFAGRGRSTSCGGAFGFRHTPACGPIQRAWDELVERAGEPETVFY